STVINTETVTRGPLTSANDAPTGHPTGDFQRAGLALITERHQSWADRIAKVADALDPFPDRAVRPHLLLGMPTASELQAFRNR
ncbi:hypothetical protein, partial [Amycolatopsis sp. cmx-8-4]|uniref:hypothetical protein n=1 Tax=Amycolatopsis sp. cmx-8-4 TaxID=2790947 RepID=UPI00397902DB